MLRRIGRMTEDNGVKSQFEWCALMLEKTVSLARKGRPSDLSK